MTAVHDQTLLAWLGSLPPDTLARILGNRPETLRQPWPRHMLALARTLGDAEATTVAIRRLAAPAIQVMRAITVLSPDATRADLARLLGVDVADADLAGVLVQLAEHALVWESPAGRFVSARGVMTGFRHPLGLGRPVADLLETVHFSQTKEIARQLGLPIGGGRTGVVKRIAESFQDSARLDAMMASGPRSVREVLLTFANDGPIRSANGISSYHPRPEMTPERWAAERGLLWAHDWGYDATRGGADAARPGLPCPVHCDHAADRHACR
jgi:hypothetical protein